MTEGGLFFFLKMFILCSLLLCFYVFKKDMSHSPGEGEQGGHTERN